MEEYNYDFFINNVLIINKQSQADKVLQDLKLSTKDFKLRDKDFKLKEYPVIVYRENGGIAFSTISKENILKLKYDKEFSRDIIELE